MNSPQLMRNVPLLPRISVCSLTFKRLMPVAFFSLHLLEKNATLERMKDLLKLELISRALGGTCTCVGGNPDSDGDGSEGVGSKMRVCNYTDGSTGYKCKQVQVE